MKYISDISPNFSFEDPLTQIIVSNMYFSKFDFQYNNT